MKLATKISAGYLILIGLMLSALVYQASIIFSLNSIIFSEQRAAQRPAGAIACQIALNSCRSAEPDSQQLSQVNFQAAHLVYQLKQDLSLIEEFTQKFFVARDGAFRDRMTDMKGRFAQDLDRLGDL